jgi:hypothetical protein
MGFAVAGRHTFRDDFTRVAHRLTIQCSFPLEKMYTLPLFVPRSSIVGTLRDIATFAYDDSSHFNPDYYVLNCSAGSFSMDDLSHTEQVARARSNLERYLRVDKQNWVDDFQDEVDGRIMIDPDPGDTNTTNDADWDEWICTNSDRDSDVMEIDFPTIEGQVRGTLQTFVDLLSYLEPEDASITNPNFSLSRSAFQDVMAIVTVQVANMHRKRRVHCTFSG